MNGQTGDLKPQTFFTACVNTGPSQYTTLIMHDIEKCSTYNAVLCLNTMPPMGQKKVKFLHAQTCRGKKRCPHFRGVLRERFQCIIQQQDASLYCLNPNTITFAWCVCVCVQTVSPYPSGVRTLTDVSCQKLQ